MMPKPPHLDPLIAKEQHLYADPLLNDKGCQPISMKTILGFTTIKNTDFKCIIGNQCMISCLQNNLTTSEALVLIKMMAGGHASIFFSTLRFFSFLNSPSTAR